MKLPRSFFDRPTLHVARDVLGKVLVHRRRGVVTSGIIVEVEAYIGESDPACHAAPGRTRRNRAWTVRHISQAGVVRWNMIAVFRDGARRYSVDSLTTRPRRVM